MEAVFVGRVEELAALHALVEAARTSVGVAVVVGDPGSGKTRLLHEAANAVDVDRRFELVGYEPERNVPLAAAAPLLRQLERAPSGEALRGMLVEAGSRLEPIRVFEAALRAFLSVEPTLVVVDDVQWLDDTSLALCHYLVRGAHAERRPLALLAAARPSTQADGLSQSLAGVLGTDRVATIELQPLDDEASRELLLALAPDLDAAAMERCRATAAGSPFWLEAVARSGEDAGDAYRLVTSRLRGAGADAVALLSLLVVAARPLSADEAAAVLDWPDGRADAATSELAARGVAVRSGSLLRPAHDLIREAARRSVPEHERRELHRRLADHIEAIAGGDLKLLREALEHRVAANVGAVDLAALLARSPQRTLLGADGLAVLSTIFETAGRESGRFGLDLAQLALELAAFDDAERLGQAAATRLAGAERADALLTAARAAFERHDGERLRELLAAARAAAGDDDVAAIEADALDAMRSLWIAGRQEEGQRLALATAMRADAVADAAGGADKLSPRERRACFAALETAVGAAMQADRPDELLQLVDKQEEFSDALDVSIVFHRTFGLRHAGRFRDAAAAARRAWDVAQRRVLPQVALEAGYVLGATLQDLGQLEEAERVAEEVAPLGARLGAASYRVPAVTRLQADLQILRGDWRDGVTRLVAHASATVDPHYRIGEHELVALALCRLGEPSEHATVLHHLERGRADAERAGCPRCAAQLRLATAYALAKVGRPDDARRTLDEWKAQTTPSDSRNAYPELRALAAIAAAEHDPAAPAAARAARDEAARVELRVEEVWQRLDESAVLERDEAVTTLGVAAEIADEIGSRTQLELARQRLRARGVRTWKRGRTEAESLSERELEIAAFVAAGATNPEIAATLFLARKTVERHVSNALRKLGLRNRTELAAWFADAHQAEGAGAPR